MNLYIKKYFTEVNWVAFVIVLFCIRYIPLETRAGPSVIKLAVSSICAFRLLTNVIVFSRGFQLYGLYFTIVLCISYLYPQTFRWSTIIYLLSFIITYIYIYDRIIIRQLFTFDFFIKVLKFILLMYTIVLVIQQCMLLIGIHSLPIINLTHFLDRGIGANSLSGEPSSTARIMTVAMLCLLRIYEYQLKHKPTITEIYKLAQYPVIGYIWSILTMGSGTGFVALGLLLLYFLQVKYVWTALFIFCIGSIVIPYIDFVPLQRAYDTFLATLTMDKDVIIGTDGSAASRITPLVNTITNLNLLNWHTWFGYGVDYVNNKGGYMARITGGYIGLIGEYGLISFIVMQIAAFKCFIRNFFSIETLLWIFLFAATFANVAYVWGAMMLMTATKYFTSQKI